MGPQRRTTTDFGNLKRVELPNSDIIEYLVDGKNRRVAKKKNGTLVKQWLYADALHPIAELDGTGTTISRFVFASGKSSPDYFIRPQDGAIFRILSDHLGSPRLIVDTATGAVVQRLRHDAFGNVTEDTSPGLTPFGFAGGIYDHETGLVRFGARDYDPLVGRWTRKDPVRFAGGKNFYAYARKDPINFYDPTGRIATAAVSVAGGAVILALGYWASQGEDLTKDLGDAIGDVWDDYAPDFDDDDGMDCYKIAEHEDLNTCTYQCPDGTTPTIERWNLEETDECPAPAKRHLPTHAILRKVSLQCDR